MSHYTPDLTLDLYEAENAFYLMSHPGRIAKFLAHYELYRRIVPLPGALFEVGVYKGASLMRFAAFRDILETSCSRPIVGFDAFGAFPRASVEGEGDRRFIERFEHDGGPGIARRELAALFDAKGHDNVALVEGDTADTLPAVLRERPETRIAFLHLDLDVYEPTAFALQALIPHLVRGALVVFDDYGMVEGATRAADEVCARLDVRLEKLPNYQVPSFFTVP